MALLITYLIVAIGVSFVCSILEAVLLSVTPTFVAQQLKENKKGAKKLAQVKDKLDHSISSILILNTFAHTMGAAGVGAQAIHVFGEQKETLIAFLLTLCILYFSEIIPKTLGATFWRNLAIPSAYVISLLVKLVYPFVWFSSLLTRMFNQGNSDVITREELLTVAALSHKGGTLDRQESQLVENILNLREVKTEDILTPRSVVHALAKEITISEAISNEKTANFTRIPVYDGTIDNVAGVVIKADLYENERQGNGTLALSDVISPIWRVSESLPVLNLLDLFIKRNEHIFIVEDHFGQTAGVVSLEDAIETFLGREIIDESDQVENLQKLAKSKYRQRLKHKFPKNKNV
ncbi:hemolysin family protein [Colwellia sp. MSW7]|jgi:CBS domain containing-hemolysin-like protein|uniref:Hemolysin family protein n=1 Tax=Colwellia maritima TaxID=2912588 RepID=A0ABS9WX61_9GAMM|nr:hemolysin family protein [Colwellia maritima]MCI2282481.1 hemolysin family protein [Colwellia maritima]